VVYKLEDFLDKNREQFNKLELMNELKDKKLLDLERQNNHFLEALNKVDEQNRILKSDYKRSFSKHDVEQLDKLNHSYNKSRFSQNIIRKMDFNWNQMKNEK